MVHMLRSGNRPILRGPLETYQRLNEKISKYPKGNEMVNYRVEHFKYKDCIKLKKQNDYYILFEKLSLFAVSNVNKKEADFTVVTIR